MYAIESRWASAVERLLEEGADVKAINEDGDSAYDISRKKPPALKESGVCRKMNEEAYDIEKKKSATFARFKKVCSKMKEMAYDIEKEKSAAFAAFKETSVYWKISDLFFQDEIVQ